MPWRPRNSRTRSRRSASRNVSNACCSSLSASGIGGGIAAILDKFDTFRGGPSLKSASMRAVEATTPQSLLGEIDDAVDASGREREAAQHRLEESRLALEVWTRVQDDLRAGHYADALLAIKE